MLDGLAGAFAIEWRDRDVAAINGASALEHIDPVTGVEALDEGAYPADVVRAHSRPRLIGGSAVIGHAEEDQILVMEWFGLGKRAGQPKERRLPVAEILESALLAHE